MSSKRALVVDDSKSARAFLSRILERHEITVDAAESAEAAIEYLTRNRPDVIFMDHMMPGMDGFQAVQSIKNNPRTSTIPILMYTSQEGDLYAGQARALGAEGVLPKQIKQSDVTKLLFQLRLVSDRRGTVEQTTFTRVTSAPELAPANESAIVMPAPSAGEAVPAAEAAAQAPVADLLPKLSLEIRAALDQTLQKALQAEVAALRNFIGATLDSHAERLQTDLAALAPKPVAPSLDLPTLIPEKRSWSKILGWTFAFLAACGAAAMSWLWWNQGAEIVALRTDLAAAYAEVETLRARPAVVSVPAGVLDDTAPMDADAESATEPAAAARITDGATAPVATATPALAVPPGPVDGTSAPVAAAPPPPTAAATVAPATNIAPESAPPQTPPAQ
jgi:CheY-like chemotaxis protein